MRYYIISYHDLHESQCKAIVTEIEDFERKARCSVVDRGFPIVGHGPIGGIHGQIHGGPWGPGSL